MTFFPPFTNKLRPGDVVYGDQDDRKLFFTGCFFSDHEVIEGIRMSKKSFMQLTQAMKVEKKLPPIIDDLNNSLAVLDGDGTSRTYVDLSLVKEYEDFLKNKAYNKKKLNAPSTKYEWEWHKIKQKCKAGLDFQTRGKGIGGKGRQNKVHFVIGPALLALMPYIPTKSNPVKDKIIEHKKGGLFNLFKKKRVVGVEKQRHITGAELRWVYRNRKDHRIHDKVQFWCVRREHEQAFTLDMTPQEKGAAIFKAVGTHLKVVTEGNLPDKYRSLFAPCHPPWDKRFDQQTARLWAQYLPTNEYDGDLTYITEI